MDGSTNGQIGDKSRHAVFGFKTDVSFLDIDLHVTSNNLEDFSAHLGQKLGIEVAAVVGQNELQPLFGCTRTGGLTA